ncbi:hypothetical protein FPV67DRAFT_1028195 [Lyophyllum atratum]|nr:hypothetical protein FPV67DRAFT_1028195 [Lyophyllum atratum]
MSQQTDPAIVIRLRSVNESQIGQKLRLVGRLLSYDSNTGFILLLEGDRAILVDVSLCVDHWSGSWVRDHLGTIRVIGHLESSPEELPIPTLPTYAAAHALDPKLVIRAVLVERAPDIDMDLWNMAIEERERL